MKPYYADETVTLYHGDCLEVLAWLEADVLVTDPPYGMAFFSGHVPGRPPRKIAGDTTTEVRDAVRSMWGDERPWLMFGTWRQPRPLGTTQVLVWDKTDGVGPGMGYLGAAFGTSHEEVYLGGPWRKQSSNLLLMPFTRKRWKPSKNICFPMPSTISKAKCAAWWSRLSGR